jgi:hypothetical protein
MSRYFEIKEDSLEDSIVKNIQEKSVSVAQQKAAGIALAAKRGEKDPDELQSPAKEMMKMSEKDLEDFAKTKHKGLPMKKEETEVAEKYDVKTAKSKMGKITVKSFDSLDDAKAHLEKMKQKGEKGIISQNGKPVTESKEEYKKVFDAAMKKFNISTPSELKTDALRKKFFNYVDANYKAKNEMVSEAVKIRTDKFSWGTMKVIEVGGSYSYPLHPEHIDLVNNLSDGKSVKYKDETNAQVTVQRKGDDLFFKKGSKTPTKVSRKSLLGSMMKNESIQEMDMKSAMKKMMGKDVKTTTSGATGFQKTMYHVSDDMQVVYNDKSNLGDVYYKGKNVDSFRGVGTPDMEKVLKKYMKKFGVKSEESKTMTGKPWSQVRVENK